MFLFSNLMHKRKVTCIVTNASWWVLLEWHFALLGNCDFHWFLQRFSPFRRGSEANPILFYYSIQLCCFLIFTILFGPLFRFCYESSIFFFSVLAVCFVKRRASKVPENLFPWNALMIAIALPITLSFWTWLHSCSDFKHDVLLRNAECVPEVTIPLRGFSGIRLPGQENLRTNHLMGV